MKRYIDFLKINESVSDFLIILFDRCVDCNGTGTYEEGCEDCYGSGYITNDYNEDESCVNCSGTGRNEEAICDYCSGEKEKEFHINFKTGVGVTRLENYCESTVDHPIEKNGKIIYDNEHRFYNDMKDIVKLIFNNKHLDDNGIVNKIAQYLYLNESDIYLNKSHESVYTKETFNVFKNHDSVKKFNL